MWRGHLFKTISVSQSKELVDFIEKNIGKKFLIHCLAGISRSQAVGKFIREFYGDEYGDVKTEWPTANAGVLAKLKREYYKKHGFFDGINDEE